MAEDVSYQFDCAKGEFHSNNEVLVYGDHNGGNQWFVVNEDRSISPSLAPHMVWAWNGKETILRKKGESESKDILIFDELEPSFKPSHYMKLTLQSHPGKGIVFTGEEK